jgi:hypothetical protein
MSFAYSLPVAVIWSAVPGDVWGKSEAHFLDTSTIHTAQADESNALDLGGYNFMTMGDILMALEYGSPEGITESEVRKIYNYMHNRLIGKAKGGDFLYQVFDEDEEQLDEYDLPFSLTSPETLISVARDEDWDYEPTIEVANRILADSFIFVDAPAVQKAALRLGYTSIIYQDVFAGGTSASKTLLGKDVEDLEGIEMEYDLDNEEVPTHKTFRVLDPEAISDVVSEPTEDVLGSLSD